MTDIDTKIKTKYGLAEDDYWFHKQSRSWIITHDAVVRIAAQEKISFSYHVIDASDDVKAMLVTAVRNDEPLVVMVGECSPANDGSAIAQSYPWCMAQKRGEDRCVLRVIAPGGGLYSDVEAEEFHRDGGDSPYKEPRQARPRAPVAEEDALMSIAPPAGFNWGWLESQIPFGKHKGKKWREFCATDEGYQYMQWLASQALDEHGTFLNLWTKGAVNALMAYQEATGKRARREEDDASTPVWAK